MSFGDAGKVLLPPGGDAGGPSVYSAHLARRADGKLVVAFNVGPKFLVYVLDPDGSVDTSFGTGGRAAATFDGGQGASGVAVTPKGTIVVSGTVGTSPPRTLALAAFTPKGGLDPSFGTGGQSTSAYPAFLTAGDVIAQPDGKILVAYEPGSGPGSAVVRFTPAGAPDTTFGTDGRGAATIPCGGLQGLALQPDGRIVAAGWACHGPNGQYSHFAVARIWP